MNEQMDIEAFGQRLRELRNGKSQTDIVKLIFEKTGLSITAQTLGRYENGKRKPDIEIIEALANTFDVSADYLLCRSDVKSTDIDLKAVCEYTGLSGKAIIGLLHLKEQCKLIAMHYGEHSQLGIMIEEAAELIQAINKMQRYGEPTKRLNYIEELADVSIMAEQLITLLDTTDYERFERFVEYKLDRQMDRIKSENNV